jgi:peptidoglycan L-alanyl-D-glutamate endopeptidase CwlK
MDNVTEERLNLLNPVLAAKVRQLAERLQQEGVQFRVVQGLRSWMEQDALYAQGRTKPGNKVTNAKGGQSWHNFGLAVDVAPDDPKLPGYQPDWNGEHPAWKRLIAVGESLGLVSGVSFHDQPHFQLTGRFPISPDDEVRQLFKDGGMQAVWEESGITA